MTATRAFIVRPFNTKEGIDFDLVERELIDPALKQLGIHGRTTGEIAEQGNIREDMFRLLVISDLVIADVSIHNANAFYELGIRHALQERHTLLIRAKGTAAKYPFDLQTDRYLEYDPLAPGANLVALVTALKATLAAPGADSPVFKLLPRLKPHDRSVLMVVPFDFQEAVTIAEQAAASGDLRLLADEATGFEWGSGGLEIVGEAQYRIRAFGAAKDTLETLRGMSPSSFTANRLLGTIYRKLAESAATIDDKLSCIARSEQAIDRVLEKTRPPDDGVETAASRGERRAHRAEALALRGSNAKTRWFEDWMGAEESERQAKALRSPHLAVATANYMDGYAEDLNSFYPGINAAALLRAQSELAKVVPAVWEETFTDSDEASRALGTVEARCARIVAALDLAVGNDTAVAPDRAGVSIWQAITAADLLFLGDEKPARIAAGYRRALAEAKPSHIEAARRNVEMFRDLGLLRESVAAALGEMPATNVKNIKTQISRVVLFTGHMIDTAGRVAEGQPRFPPTPEAEHKARELILTALTEEMAQEGGVALGISSGACGGDILFHEVCLDLGIPTQLFLALPRAEFQVTSVQHGGPRWVERYNNLCDRVPPRVLGTTELPRWLGGKSGYDIWQRTNLWMLFNSLALEPRRLTLVALFNADKEPEGEGGTGHLVNEALRRGVETVVLDANKLLT